MEYGLHESKYIGYSVKQCFVIQAHDSHGIIFVELNEEVPIL